jgi:hypothetical protein
MTNIPDAFTDLTVALRELAEALKSGRPELVLAAETPLEAAARGLVHLSKQGNLDPIRQRQGISDVREALATVRLLGDASATLERVVRPARTYDANGHSLSPRASGAESRA